MGNDEELVGLSQGDFAGLQVVFSLGGGGSLKVKRLNRLKEEDVWAEVDKKGTNRLARWLRHDQSPTLAKSDSMLLVPLATTTMCSSVDVLLRVVGEEEPEFCAEGWQQKAFWKDWIKLSPRPARCLRRRLLVAERSDLSMVLISFNTSREWEHSDPVSALCRRRIAFSALNLLQPSKHDYDDVALASVTMDHVVTWLHESLNLLKMGPRAREDRMALFLVGWKRTSWGRFCVDMRVPL